MTTGAQAQGDLPHVGVVWDRLSVAPRRILRAAQGLCRLTLLFRHDEDFAQLGRGLSRVVGTASAAAAGDLCLDHVMTFSESSIRVASLLRSELGLPGNPLHVDEALTNKRVQRRLLNLNPDGQVASLSLLHHRDYDALRAGALGFPVVVKPEAGTESRGVRRLEGGDEVRDLQLSAWVESTPYVAEEYLEGDVEVAGVGWGDYVSVESASTDGEHRVLAVLGKGVLRPGFRETGNVFPDTLSESSRTGVTQLVMDALDRLGVVTGVCHTEVKLTPRGPRIIEVNGRAAGGLPQLMDFAAGIDVVRAVLENACGRPTAGDWRAPDGQVSAWLTLYPDRGYVEATPFARAEEQLLADPHVRQVSAVGSYSPRPMPGGPSHSIEVLIGAPTHAELKASIDASLAVTRGQ